MINHPMVDHNINKHTIIKHTIATHTSLYSTPGDCQRVGITLVLLWYVGLEIRLFFSEVWFSEVCITTS